MCPPETLHSYNNCNKWVHTG